MNGITCWILCTFDLMWMRDFQVANAKGIPCLVLGDIGNQPGERVDNGAT